MCVCFVCTFVYVCARAYMNMCACVRVCEGSFIRVLGYTLVSTFLLRATLVLIFV